MDEGKYDAIILTAKGLNRLSLKHRIIQKIIPAELFLSSCGQGEVPLVFNLEYMIKKYCFLFRFNYINTFIEIYAARAFCGKLESGYQIPIGSYVILKNKI